MSRRWFRSRCTKTFAAALAVSAISTSAAPAATWNASPRPEPSATPSPLEVLPIPVNSPLPAVEPTPSPAPKKKRTPRPRPEKSASSARPRAAAGLPPLLKEAEDRYAKSPGLTASFTQVNELVAMNQKKTSTGHIEIKRPDKVRWQTETPDANLLVSDGRHFWFYTPPFDPSEHGQLIERKAAQVQSKLAQTLLSGSFSTAKGTKISAESKTRFRLIPKAGTAGDIVKATIEVDPGTKLIQKVMLYHRDGNKSEITLSSIKLNQALDDGDFVFKAPPNTDRVTE